MPGLIAASGLGGWTYGGSILTFAFYELLFLAVAATLYVLFTKPHAVPGHRYQPGVPMTNTSAPGKAEQASSGETRGEAGENS